jgi:hypothetical protein
MQGEAPRRPHTLIKIPSDVNEELAQYRAKTRSKEFRAAARAARMWYAFISSEELHHGGRRPLFELPHHGPA